MLETFDARHFRHIQTKGYQIDTNHAFYPLFPLLMPESALASLLV